VEDIDWRFEELLYPTPLGKFKSIWWVSVKYTPTPTASRINCRGDVDHWSLDNNPTLTPQDHVTAHKEIDMFVKNTMQALKARESKRQQYPLSLNYLARVDISIYLALDGNPQYYVNDVSRAPGVHLWEAELSGGATLEKMATYVQKALVESIVSHRNMYSSE
jgi:hypothetical protein